MKKAIEKGNIDGAKIYAQNAIRKKTEALNYLRLASRLDAVVSRLDTQAKMNMINSSMSQIVRALDKVTELCLTYAVTVAYKDCLVGFFSCLRQCRSCLFNFFADKSAAAQALASNNLERVASTMDQFERQFENLDVQSQFVEGAMNNQASLSTPEEDVNLLMQQVRGPGTCSAKYLLQLAIHSAG